MHILDLLEQRQEIGKLFGEQLLHWALSVDGEAEEICQNIALGKANFLRINSRVGDNSGNQVLLILSVHDGETGRITKRTAVAPQHAVADRVKRAAPDSAGINRQ